MADKSSSSSHAYLDGGMQSDQIGRIFAYGRLFNLGSLWGNYRNSKNDWATFSTVKVVY
jgi:hypothetical protein